MALNKVVLGTLVLAFFVMSTVPVCGQSDFSFYAVYDRLVDTESLEGQIWCAAMSGDGNRLIFSTTTDTFLYTVNADGSDLTLIPLPADLIVIGEVAEVAIDYDGSRAFFLTRDAGFLIFKVEGGVATQILDTNDYPEILGCMGIETTADGEYVYFRETCDDVWRIRHGGGTPEKVIEDTEVPREEVSQSQGRKVKDFAISADGSTIAFVLSGYLDPIDGYRYKEQHELFVLDGDGYRQLTNDDKKVIKDYVDISGDGTTIVFRASSPQNKWYSIRSDGSAKIALENSSYNVAGSVLDYDGTRMFYSDAGSVGGRLVNTDGSGGIDLIPYIAVVLDIPLVAHNDLCISDDGSRISFRYHSVLHVGHLNDPEAVPDSPTIHNIIFDPPAMPRGDPGARINLSSKISDPQGLADIERTSIGELVDGRLKPISYVPVYFRGTRCYAANDIGDWPDETASDGIFSSAGKPGSKIDELDQMTVRMGVMDASKTVVIADKVLSIGGVMPTSTPVRTSTPTKTPISTVTPTRTPIPAITPTPAIPPTAEFSGLIFESRSKSSGSTIQIPLTLKAINEDIGNMDITLGYDPSVLEATEVIKGGLTANSVFDYNILDKGTIKMSLSMAGKQGFSGDGSIAYIVFDVIGSEGSDSRLEIVSLSANRAEDMAPMSIPTQDGVFLVSGVEECRGDCNGDGEITALDALCALQMAVEKIPEDMVMDVNGDGRVTSLDARKILRIAAGLEALP